MQPSSLLINMLRVTTALILVLLSCNLPSALPTQPGATPLPTAAATTPTVTLAPTPTEIPASETPPLTFEAAIRRNVTNGKWTYEQGLLSGLRFMAGELSSQTVFGDQPLLSTEGTGLIQSAQRYVIDGQDAQTKAEIEHYLNLLMPSPETLDKFSSPATQSNTGHHLASPTRQDVILCQTLWRNSFVTTDLVDCLKVREDSSSGTTVRFYYPAYWDPTDTRLASVDAIMAAANTALSRYNTYGPNNIHPVYIVLTDLAYFSTDGEDSGFLPEVFAAASQFSRPVTSCHVGIFPYGLSGGIGSLQQTIAHELFHCYQYTNLAAQTFGGPAGGFTTPNSEPLPNTWWVEGSAEFFGALVYPRNNDEWIFNSSFDSSSPTTSLLDLEYENYLFFQFLIKQAGFSEQAIINMLTNMPTDGGRAEQQNALAGVSGINDHFNNFARAYMDRRLADAGGGSVPVNPQPGNATLFGLGERSEPFESQPFVVARFQLEFEDDTRFTLNAVENDGIGKYAVRPTAFVGAWASFKPSLNTACDEKSYILVVTNTAPAATDNYQVTLDSRGEALEGDNPNCDSCLLGKWQLTNDSDYVYMANLTSRAMAILPAMLPDAAGSTSNLVNISGSLTLTFMEDQRVSGDQSGLTFEYLVTGPDGDSITSIGSYNGTATANYEILEANDERHIIFSEGQYDLALKLTWLVGGQVLADLPPQPFTSDSNLPFFLASPVRYECREDPDILLYTTAPELGTLQFYRP
jgi:hypothetical protein